ncbi:MAG: hypothetical protein EP341_07385, partial [Sphingomonadales bacterium]
MSKIRALRLSTAALAIACVGTPALAHDGHEMDLSTDQQVALDIYGDVIGFRTARGHQQAPAMVNYLVARFKADGFADEDIMVTDYDSEGE